MKQEQKALVVSLIKDYGMSNGEKARRMNDAGIVIRMDMSQRGHSTLIDGTNAQALQYPYDYRYIDTEDVYSIEKAVRRIA